MATFGTPQYGGNFKPSPKGFPKDGGTLTVRILPPLFSCIDTGEWAVGHCQHFGYDTQSPTDASKRKYNPFYCVERVKWDNGVKLVVQDCPEDKLINEKKADWESRKAEMEKKGIPEADIRSTLKPLVEWLKRHSRDFKYYVNVKDVSGEYYTLKLPSKVKKQVDAIVKEFRERKRPLDPIAADQGLWFVITRSGKGIQTEYSTKVVMEDVTVDGETLQKVKLAPLTDADAEKAEAKCYDLHDVGIRKLSVDKVKALVATGGDEEAVAAIFASSDKREVSPSTETRTPPSTPPASTAPPAVKSEPAPKVEKPIETVVVTPPTEDDEVAKAMKALVAAQARAKAKQEAAATAQVAPPAEQQKAAAAPTSVPADDGGGPDEEDEETFLARFRTT